MTTSIVNQLKTDACKFRDPLKANRFKKFFKTGKGQYGFGDQFIGLTVIQCRIITKKYRHFNPDEFVTLVKAKIHEYRLIGLLIWVYHFEKNKTGREHIYKLYLDNIDYVNNWDLVDLTAPKIIGAYLFDKDKSLIYKFARFGDLWHRRIAMLSTYYFIRHSQYQDAINIAKILINDEHDLIHKAVGWMLREIGKRNITVEEKFLNEYKSIMPRTMLRYAIEKFPETKRQKYLKKF